MRFAPCTLSILAACAGAPAATSRRPAPAPAPATPAQPVAACASPEHRQLDFWIGDWDVTIRTRSAPTAETWAESKGTQRIEAILGGCAIAEQFTASGPQPWAGRSYSTWQPKLGKWRQTWVDDSGNYLAFTGGLEDGELRLYGEPREIDGGTVQMRMVFQRITADGLHWEWQRSSDGWATSTLMMAIDYTRQR